MSLTSEILLAAVSVIEEICSTGISESIHIPKTTARDNNSDFLPLGTLFGGRIWGGGGGGVLPFEAGESHFGLGEVMESENVA